MAIYSKKLIGSNAVGVDKSQFEISSPTTGQKGYNSRGQTVYWNGSKWTNKKPNDPGVTITNKRTNKDGSKTTYKYNNRGNTIIKYDSKGNKVSEEGGKTMDDIKASREQAKQQDQLQSLKEVGATGYFDEKGKLHVTGAQGKKYKGDMLWGSIWQDLRREAGMSPSISNPWYEGPNPPLGPPTDHVDPTKPPTQPPPQPPQPPAPPPPPPEPPITGPVDPPMPEPPQDPLPDPRPEDGPPELPDTDEGYPFPVFSNQSRNPREFFEQWMNGELGTPDLLQGYGPPGGNGPPGQQQQQQQQPPPPPPDEPPADPNDPDTTIGDLFPDGFNFAQNYNQLVQMVGPERAMQMIQQWFAGGGGAGGGGGKGETPNQLHTNG